MRGKKTMSAGSLDHHQFTLNWAAVKDINEGENENNNFDLVKQQKNKSFK